MRSDGAAKLIAFAFTIAVLLPPASGAAGGEPLNVRGGLPNLCRMLARKERTRIVYLGGGITHGLGASKSSRCYRALLTRHLRSQFAKAPVVEYDRSIPGTNSWLAAFRTQTEVVRHYIPLGLVVVEFAVDDAGQLKDRVLASVEGIVRQIRARKPTADVLFLYALTKDRLATYEQGRLPEVVQWHEQVAAHYGIPSVDMARFVADMVRRGELTFEEFSADGVHPTDKGHALYVEAIKPLIARCKAAAEPDAASAEHKPPQPLSPRAMDKAQLVSYERATLEKGWLAWQESPVRRFFHVVHCDQPGPTITLRFVGDTVGYFDALGPDSGELEFSLDGSAWRPIPAFDDAAKAGYRAHAALVAEELDPGKTHELKMRVADRTPAGSKGRHARLAFFLVNGRPVYDDPHRGMTALQRIDAVYSTMAPVTYAPPADRWRYLPKTMQRLRRGPALRVVMLGDSIVNDTAASSYEHLLMRLYPQCKVTKIRSVRGSTGCWWYKDDNRVKPYVLDHRPDLLMIGGISQRNDVDSIREVIRQVRAAQPDVEVLVMTGAFGSRDPRMDPKWTYEVDPAGDGYRSRLMRMAAEEKVEFLDVTGPWGRCIRESEHALGSFKRDRVHANDRGKQILGRILERFFAPK